MAISDNNELRVAWANVLCQILGKLIDRPDDENLIGKSSAFWLSHKNGPYQDLWYIVRFRVTDGGRASESAG